MRSSTNGQRIMLLEPLAARAWGSGRTRATRPTARARGFGQRQKVTPSGFLSAKARATVMMKKAMIQWVCQPRKLTVASG